MNKFELCIKLIVDDVKADVMYTLNSYSDFNNVDLYFNDCSELELEDGSLLTYRKLMNAVRRELKSEGLLK